MKQENIADKKLLIRILHATTFDVFGKNEAILFFNTVGYGLLLSTFFRQDLVQLVCSYI